MPVESAMGAAPPTATPPASVGTAARSRLDESAGVSAALVALAALAVYATSLGNRFAYDDVAIIVENARVHAWRDLPAVWLTPYWPTLGRELGLYRPLTIFGFALQWALGGGRPWLFHAVSVGLHAADSVLVLLLLRRLVSTRASLLGALAFAVHPVHTEAVANVVGQAELLAALGVLAACLLYLGRDDERIRAPRFAGILACYALAMLAKEIAIVAPALLLAADLARRPASGRVALVRRLREAAPILGGMLAVAGLYLLLRVHVLGALAGTGMTPSLSYLHGPDRWLTALRVWPEYLRLLVFPAELSSDYSPGVILPVHHLTPTAALGAALLATTTLLALAAPRAPRLALPALWFLVAILPVSNLILPIGVLLAERTLYLPSVAVSLALALAWSAVAGRPAARLAGVALAALLVAAGVRTAVRNPVWRDTGSANAALVASHPESYVAQWAAAVSALQRGDTASSEIHWALARRIWPDDPRFLSDYGAFSLMVGSDARAVRLLERADSLHPGIPRVRALLREARRRLDRHPQPKAQ